MSLLLPVRYPVKHYSHLDAGAPQMSDVNGAIKTILKACMVTGYGDKAGAGWTALFDDAFRVVLRRPLRTGNPPDIKIENGISNRHQIISQDNPTSITDAKKLASVNLLARDSAFGTQWHVMVTDFGFLFCYQMGEDATTDDKNHMIYCGSLKKMQDSDPDFFVTSTSDTIGLNGKGGYFVEPFLSTVSALRDMRTNSIHREKQFISLNVVERHFNNDYIAQSVIASQRAILPFYCSISEQYENLLTSNISISSRPMLRYVNKLIQVENARAFYIPLDFWEL